VLRRGRTDLAKVPAARIVEVSRLLLGWVGLASCCAEAIIVVCSWCLSFQIVVALVVMVFGSMVLCKIVGFVRLTFFPIDDKLALAHPVPNPVETYYHGLGPFLLDGVIGDTAVVMLSVTMGVGGCGWPSSSRHVRRGHAALPLWNKVPNSASAALDMTSFMIWHGISIAPLCVGAGASGCGALLGFRGMLLK
jgi:hypothetical protein